jgi:hypothetical protein
MPAVDGQHKRLKDPIADASLWCLPAGAVVVQQRECGFDASVNDF